MTTKRKPIGTPVKYPKGHPYNDPRKRTADAVGMLETLKLPRGPRTVDQEVDEKVKDFVAFMWAVEGKELSRDEVLRYRRGLMEER
jgi:hypothetical protein